MNFVQEQLNNHTQYTNIALLADNRNFQPVLSVAFNRLSQGVSETFMRGSATMLTARNLLL